MCAKSLELISDRPPRDDSGCDCGCAQASAIRRSGRYLSLLPAFAIVMLPKCPLCLAAWLGTLSLLGANSWMFVLYGAPLTLLLASCALLALVVRVRDTRQMRPLFLGLFGALILLMGREFLDAPLVIYSGLLLLSVSIVWSNRLPIKPLAAG